MTKRWRFSAEIDFEVWGIAIVFKVGQHEKGFALLLGPLMITLEPVQ